MRRAVRMRRFATAFFVAVICLFALYGAAAAIMTFDVRQAIFFTLGCLGIATAIVLAHEAH